MVAVVRKNKQAFGPVLARIRGAGRSITEETALCTPYSLNHRQEVLRYGPAAEQKQVWLTELRRHDSQKDFLGGPLATTQPAERCLSNSTWGAQAASSCWEVQYL